MTTFPTLWQLLALDDEALETYDLVAANLIVARGIPGLKSLNIAKYVCIVDEWTDAFRRELPGMERTFHQTPYKWKNDIRFFRVGMLQGFLGHEIGLRYVEAHKNATEVWYTDPGHLFLHGLIDTKEGTCGTMSALHVAISRRLGWPVTLVCCASHYISRYDGDVYHNIEATSTRPGSFASDSDEEYAEKFKLPKQAISCGSDLCRLTARQMIGAFLSSRGRHYADTHQIDLADAEYALARVLFPQHRRAYIAAVTPFLTQGIRLFAEGELGSPESLLSALATTYNPKKRREEVAGRPTAAVEFMKCSGEIS